MLARSRSHEPLPLIVVRPGRAPIRQSETCPGPMVVEAGVLRLSMVVSDGREIVVDIAGPGDVVGGPAGSPSLLTIRAVGPARLRPAPSGVEDHAAARLAALVCDLAWRDVAGRIERRLGDLAGRFGRPVPGGVEVSLRLSHDDLASMVGASRESVSRAIGRLRRDGRIRTPRPGRYVVRYPLRTSGD